MFSAKVITLSGFYFTHVGSRIQTNYCKNTTQNSKEDQEIESPCSLALWGEKNEVSYKSKETIAPLANIFMTLLGYQMMALLARAKWDVRLDHFICEALG